MAQATAYRVSDTLLAREDFRAACRARDFRTVFQLMKKYDGASQDRICAPVEGLTQSRVSRIIHGDDRVASIDLIERIIDSLGIPGSYVGLIPREWETNPTTGKAGATVTTIRPGAAATATSPTDAPSGVLATTPVPGDGEQPQLASTVTAHTGTPVRLRPHTEAAFTEASVTIDRRTSIDSVPSSFSADILDGLWVTSYKFHLGHGAGTGTHADITRITAQSSGRIVATNYMPDPRTKGFTPAFRNDIEAQIANRHLIGFWKNASDTRYFGSLHLAVLPGESVMQGYYTTLLDDVTVDAMTWKWVRLDPVSLLGVQLQRLVLKDPDAIHALLVELTENLPLPVSAIATEGE